MTTRRRFTPEFKAKVALELVSGSKNLAAACRQYNLKPEVASRWKGELVDRAVTIFMTDEHHGQEQASIAELERMIGRLTLELEIAKKGSSLLGGQLSRSERWS